jgi:hypothetical protein
LEVGGRIRIDLDWSTATNLNQPVFGEDQPRAETRAAAYVERRLSQALLYLSRPKAKLNKTCARRITCVAT